MNKLFKIILWKVKDHNGVWHWWCETPDGEVIDLTKDQYELNNNPVPSSSRASKLKEQGKDPVLFGLSDEDYELLAKNFAQIRAFMIKQGMTLDQYREYYESKESKPTKPE